MTQPCELCYMTPPCDIAEGEGVTFPPVPHARWRSLGMCTSTTTPITRWLRSSRGITMTKA